LLLAVGLVCCLQLARLVSLPRVFFTGGAPAAPAREKNPEAAALSQKRRRTFEGSSRFLKFLLSNTEMKVLGDGSGLTEVEKATNTVTALSKKGDYYPYARMPSFRAGKVLIIAGERDDVLQAFKMIREKTQEVSPERRISTFLFPSSQAGALIGTEGDNIRAKSEATGSVLTVRATPLLESQVIVGSKKPEAADEIAEWLLDEQGSCIDEMRKMLSTTYQAGGANSARTSMFVTLTDGQVARLMGKEGTMMKFFSTAFRVNIEIDRKNRGPDDKFIVKLTGLTGDIHAAHREILERFVIPKGELYPWMEKKGESASEGDGVAAGDEVSDLVSAGSEASSAQVEA